MNDFKQLGIKDWIIQALLGLSITKPTEIQLNCIPQILQGNDCIGAAKTGSGKTAAFALPILQHLGNDPFGVHSLILTPTRELAFQIAEQFRIIGNSIGLRLAVVVGGLDMMQQALELTQKPHIIIATPGRLADHIKNTEGVANIFKRSCFLVIDEADRLLTSDFENDLDVILNVVSKKRQTLLFSATMTDEIKQLEFKPDKKPFVFSCTTSRFDTVDKLDQKYIFIPSLVREAYLVHLIQTFFNDKTCIIFASRPRTCEIIRLMLKQLDIRSTSLHSQMSQPDRLSSLAKFKGGIVPILVSTDVGSRGLDIPSVQVVINYELPADPADYIHRIGRTARAGKGGLSLSIVTERDVDLVHHIESKTEKKMVELPVEENQVLKELDKINLLKRQAKMQLMDEGFGEKRAIQKRKRQGMVSKK